MTYSKVLGWRTAAILPVLLCAASAGCLTGVALRVDLGPVLPCALGGAVLLMAAGTMVYLSSPRIDSSKLRVMAELYALAAAAGLPLALALRFKLALGGCR
jgi:fucose permease